MLKKIMIRVAKVAVLASLIVSTVVMSGCKYDVSMEYNGTMKNGLCDPGGNECKVKARFSSGEGQDKK